MLERFDWLRDRDVETVRIRCHGDFHLGQVLYRDGSNGKPDFVFLDFEGEPAIPLRMRRGKSCALRDVASMLRSLEYAAWMAHRRLWSAESGIAEATRDATTAVWGRTMGAAFLDGHRRGLQQATTSPGVVSVPIIPSAAREFELVLDAFCFEKAMYELTYELNNRPDWFEIRLRGLAELLGES